jgi:KaiC/GvpD/RAD55 family RecA-like ATPase
MAQTMEEDVRIGVEGLDGLLGVRRGEVTEIYGAPGVGKRAFG